MGTSTFSGPVRAGTIKSTTGTTLGTDIANVGTPLLVQYANVSQSTIAVDTTITIPANSIIVGARIVPTVAFSTTTVTIGKDSSGSGLGSAASVTVAMKRIDPTNLTQGAARVIGSSDVSISVDFSATGSGEGRLVVEYIQTA